MPNINYAIGSDYPVLSAYMECRERVSIIRGPRGSAKTFSSAQRCLMHMMDQETNDRGVRPTSGMITRDSYGELMSTTVKDFMSVFEGMGDFVQGKSGPPVWHSKPRCMLPDGSELNADVTFQSSGVDDAEERVKGFQLTYAWFNEMSGTDTGFLRNARASCSRYPSGVSGGVPCTWYGIFGDCNSYDDTHWLFELSENPPDGWRFFHQPGGVLDTGQTNALGNIVWALNPAAENLANLVPDYYMDLCQGNPDSYIKVLLANQYGFHVEGKPVHENYSDAVHCAEEPFEPDERYEIILGVDFGRQPAAAFLQHWEGIGRWVVFDEFCSYDMSAATFGPELKRYIDRRYPGFKVVGYGDPAGEAQGQATDDTPIRVLRAAGIPIRGTYTNNTTIRRAALANVLRRLALDKRPAFQISPRAKWARKGLSGGWAFRRRKIKDQEVYDEKPDKLQFSHICEGLEYGLVGGGEGRAALRPSEPQMMNQNPRPQFAESNW